MHAYLPLKQIQFVCFFFSLSQLFLKSTAETKSCDGYWQEASGVCSLTVSNFVGGTTPQDYCKRKGGILASVEDGDALSSSFTCTKNKVSIQACKLVGNIDISELSIFTPYCADEITPTMYLQRRTATQVSLTYPDYLNQIETLASDVPGWSAFVQRRTIVVIHGYMDNSKTWVQDVGTALLKVEDANLLLFDWSGSKGAGDLDYLTSAADIRVMGRLVALMLDRMISLGLPQSRVWCVGHSLGAQTCGAAGKESINTIGRITGLDPAAPAFDDYKDPQYRLNKHDAVLVDVIHTGGNRDSIIPVINDYGTLIPCGDADFYPNGGTDQPGCSALGNDAGCSHSRSHDLFMETITSAACSGGEWIPQNCSVVTATMGYHWDEETSGIFYSVTKGKSPFCEGAGGMRLVDPSLPKNMQKIVKCMKTGR